MKFLLNIYDVIFNIEGYSKIVQNLKKDFQFFLSEKMLVRNINLRIHFEKPDTSILLKQMIYSRKDYSVFWSQKKIFVVYDAGLLAVFDYQKGIADLYSKNFDLLYEISYLFIQSMIGEYLEKKNLFRIHAAGFSFNKKGFLLVGQSGSGKSALSLNLLKQKDFFFLSDDTPLISFDFMLNPFPIRIGVSKKSLESSFFSKKRIFTRRKWDDKVLFDTSNFKKNIGKTVILKKIFFLRKTDKNPYISKAGIISSFYLLFKHLVLGLGTPQVLEFVLKPELYENMNKLVIISKKLFLSFRILCSCELSFFYTNKDFSKNISVLKQNLS